MSLDKIEKLNTNIVNLILFVQSPSVAYLIRNKLKERFKMHRDFIVDVTTQKQLHNAKLDSYVAPMMCDKWLIHVDADKLAKKDLIAAVDNNTHYGVTVYWTEKWAVYNQLVGLDSIKKQGVHSPQFRITRMGFYEIRNLLENEIPPKKQLPEALINFVAKNYQYDIQSVMDLIALQKSGNQIDNKKELIEAIGVGGNSIANLTINILKARPKTESSRKRNIASVIKLIRDLTYTYNYMTIRRFVLNNIDGCIEMKQLQLMGLYNKPNKEVPEAFDTKRLSMLRRFESIILNEVDLPRLLNLKICLLKYNDFNAEVALLQAVTEYFDNIQVEPDKPRKPRKKKDSQ